MKPNKKVEEWGEKFEGLKETEEKCCKFHDRLDLKFPGEVDDPTCGLAGSGEERYSEERFCCKECPAMKEEKERIIKLPKRAKNKS